MNAPRENCSLRGAPFARRTRSARAALALAALALAAPAIAQLLPPPQRSATGKALQPPALKADAPKAVAGEAKPFALAAGERMGWVLVVGQPGTIDVAVRATGTPFIVSLTRPNGTTVEQTGNGEMRFSVPVTAQDNGSGQIWKLGVRSAAAPAAPAPKIATQAFRREVPIVVRGTVTVSHPPGDMARAQAELQQRAQPILASMKDRPTPAQIAAAVETEAQQFKAEAEAKEAQRQRALLEQLRARLATGQPLQQASGTGKDNRTMVPVQGGAARPLILAQPLPPAPAPSGGNVAPVGTQSKLAQTAVAPATITSLSQDRGVPGDSVLIHGSGFGAQQGTVRIDIAPGQSLVAPVVVWSDTGIVVKVPDASGIPASYRGQLSVVPAGSAAASTAFEFVPAKETRILVPDVGQVSIAGPGGMEENICHPWCRSGVDLGNLFFGHTGQDEFFRNARLKNGWHVVQVGIGYRKYDYQANSYRYSPFPHSENSAEANMLETHVGTDWPYVRVGWWHDAFSSVGYWPRIVIEGPKGVPHF